MVSSLNLPKSRLQKIVVSKDGWTKLQNSMVIFVHKVSTRFRNYDGADGPPKHLYMWPHLLLGNSFW